MGWLGEGNTFSVKVLTKIEEQGYVCVVAFLSIVRPSRASKVGHFTGKREILFFINFRGVAQRHIIYTKTHQTQM